MTHLSFQTGSLEVWEKKHGKMGRPMLYLYPEKGDQIYRCWVRNFDHGTIVMAKILSVIRKKRVRYAFMIEHLDKIKLGMISKGWVSIEDFDNRRRKFIEDIDEQYGSGYWKEVKNRGSPEFYHADKCL